MKIKITFIALSTLLLTTAVSFKLSAQKTKRNLIANSCFKDDLMNWRKGIDPNLATSSIKAGNPISEDKPAGIDDGDWDGNLIPSGNLKSEDIRPTGERSYWVTGVNHNAGYVTDQNPIDGNKSIYFYKSANPEDGFWELSYHFQFWINENATYKVSFKAKSSKDGQIVMRTHPQPWGWAGGLDFLSWEVDVNSELKSYDLTTDNSIFHKENLIGNAGPYGWDGINLYEGKQSFFASLLDPKTPNDIEFWMDDISIKEIVSLLDFEVVGVPITMAVGTEAQLSLGEFVTPTNAPTTVVYSVENGTGYATIDQNGLLSANAAGDVTVTVSSPDGIVTKQSVVTISSGTAVAGVTENVISIYPTVVAAGKNIQITASASQKVVSVKIYSLMGELFSEDYNTNIIKTKNLPVGVYLAKLASEGFEKAIKFIVK